MAPEPRVPVAGGQQARRARVRPVVVRQVLVDGLEILHLRAHVPVLVAIGGFRESFGERHAGALGSVREILEVAAVADVRGIDAEAPVAGQLGDVVERGCDARSTIRLDVDRWADS